MSEAILEAPTSLQQAMQAHVQQNEPAQAPSQQQAPKTTETTQEQPVQQKETQTQEVQKASADATKPPKKWEQLAKKDEPATEENTTEQTEEEYPESAPQAQNAWTKIKKELKELRAKRAEWDGERSNYTVERQKLDAQIKELSERASKFKDEDLAALQKFREEQAIYNIEQTETYQTQVTRPWQEGNNTLQEVSEYTKIPTDKFKEILVEPNGLLRNSKIGKLLKTARMTDVDGSEVELDPSEIAALTTQISEAGRKLHDATHANKTLKDEAALKGQQRATQEEAAKIKAQQEAKEVWNRSSQEIESTLRVGLKDLIEAGVLKDEDIKQGGGEELAEDPMDRAYAVRASYLVPVMTEALRSAHAKIAQLENERKERQAARPGVKPQPHNGVTGGSQLSLQDAMRAHTQEYGVAR